MNDMTTVKRHVRRITPKPPPLLLAPEWRVRVVTAATVRAGRLRALVAAYGARAPTYANAGFRERVEVLVARHQATHAQAHQT